MRAPVQPGGSGRVRRRSRVRGLQRCFLPARSANREPRLPTPAFRRYGGFWIRFVARCIDGLILSVVYILLVLMWTIVMQRTLLYPGETPQPGHIAMMWSGLALIYLISSVCFVAYESWFLLHRGATPGKLALGLRVIRSDGSALTSGRSVGRAFGYLLDSVVPLAIGFIIAGFDAEKRALHDHLCDTRVVYKSA